jgi:hypothetical protein
MELALRDKAGEFLERPPKYSDRNRWLAEGDWYREFAQWSYLSTGTFRGAVSDAASWRAGERFVQSLAAMAREHVPPRLSILDLHAAWHEAHPAAGHVDVKRYDPLKGAAHRCALHISQLHDFALFEVEAERTAASRGRASNLARQSSTIVVLFSPAVFACWPHRRDPAHSGPRTLR